LKRKNERTKGYLLTPPHRHRPFNFQFLEFSRPPLFNFNFCPEAEIEDPLRQKLKTADLRQKLKVLVGDSNTAEQIKLIPKNEKKQFK
jgi:hypothetical protein